jgi:acyl carrier protein
VAGPSILWSIRVSLIACRGLNARAQRSIVVWACAISLVGCGSSTTEPASAGATATQSSAAAPSTSDGAVPATLRSTIASTLKVDEATVVPEATFANDLGANELSMVELVMAYERVFKIAIPDADADRFTTVQDVIDYLRKRNVLR